MSQKLCNIQGVSFIVSPSTPALWYILLSQEHAVLSDLLVATFKKTLFVFMGFEALLR